MRIYKERSVCAAQPVGEGAQNHRQDLIGFFQARFVLIAGQNQRFTILRRGRRDGVRQAFDQRHLAHDAARFDRRDLLAHPVGCAFGQGHASLLDDIGDATCVALGKEYFTLREKALVQWSPAAD